MLSIEAPSLGVSLLAPPAFLGGWRREVRWWLLLSACEGRWCEALPFMGLGLGFATAEGAGVCRGLLGCVGARVGRRRWWMVKVDALFARVQGGLLLVSSLYALFVCFSF